MKKYFCGVLRRYISQNIVAIAGTLQLRESLPKTGPLRFGSENLFPLHFAHEYILVQK